MMTLSKVIQKVEGYDWEESKPFTVTGAEQNEGNFRLKFKADSGCADVVRSLMDKLYAYKSDKTILVAIGFCAVYNGDGEWTVTLSEKDNPGYEGKKEEEAE